MGIEAENNLFPLPQNDERLVLVVQKKNIFE